MDQNPLQQVRLHCGAKLTVWWGFEAHREILPVFLSLIAGPRIAQG
jgi:hypothetical protein